MVIRCQKSRGSRKRKTPMHPRDHYRPTCTLAKIGVNGSRPKTPTSHLAKSEGYLVLNGRLWLRKRKNLMKIWLLGIKRGTRLKKQSTNEARTCDLLLCLSSSSVFFYPNF